MCASARKPSGEFVQGLEARIRLVQTKKEWKSPPSSVSEGCARWEHDHRQRDEKEHGV